MMKITVLLQSLQKMGNLLQIEGQFDEPHGIDFDSQGNVYVVDTQNNRIQVFTPDGQYIKSIGKPGSAPGEFLLIHDIDIDDNDIIHVLDSRDAHPNKIN
jgi:DNA-binding beta-propeller fold protein YncE